jgi:hypothetical protein
MVKESTWKLNNEQLKDDQQNIDGAEVNSI